MKKKYAVFFFISLICTIFAVTFASPKYTERLKNLPKQSKSL